MYTAKNTVKIIVKLCKYPVVYLDGKTRVENNKSKFKKKKACLATAQLDCAANLLPFVVIDSG